MTIRGMTVQNYWSGLVVKGSQHDAAKWNGGNVIEGMTFTAIGQSRPEQKPAFSVITLQRSRDNVVRNNTFLRVGNSVACGGFHAIYMAHASSGNRIEGNVFQGGCGDVIKLRDASSGNRIIRNRFVDQRDAPVVDSYCDMGRMTECKVQECPSSGNVISDNIFVNSPDKVRAVHRATVPGCPASRS